MAWWNSGTWLGEGIENFPDMLSQLCIAINEREACLALLSETGWITKDWFETSETKSRPTPADFEGLQCVGSVLELPGWLASNLQSMHLAIANMTVLTDAIWVDAEDADYDLSGLLNDAGYGGSWLSLTRIQDIRPWLQIRNVLDLMKKLRFVPQYRYRWKTCSYEVQNEGHPSDIPGEDEAEACWDAGRGAAAWGEWSAYSSGPPSQIQFIGGWLVHYGARSPSPYTYWLETTLTIERQYQIHIEHWGGALDDSTQYIAEAEVYGGEASYNWPTGIGDLVPDIWLQNQSLTFPSEDVFEDVPITMHAGTATITTKWGDEEHPIPEDVPWGLAGAPPDPCDYDWWEDGAVGFGGSPMAIQMVTGETNLWPTWTHTLAVGNELTYG